MFVNPILPSTPTKHLSGESEASQGYAVGVPCRVAAKADLTRKVVKSDPTSNLNREEENSLNLSESP